MVLEACMICIDNSEFMRNGDFMPTRMEAQQDAANLVCGAKSQSNVENTVGIITMAGKSPAVQVGLTPSADLGKLLSALSSIKVEGKSNFTASLQVAQLALKHRQNRSQHQRVIVFVGSPITEEKAQLERLAKNLRKNTVAVDIVNFGEEASNTEKLEHFINTVKSGENSHLITVPAGPHILSDILLTSPLVCGEEGGAGGAAAGFGGMGGGASEFGGIDPNLDPELAMAIRISMEEARQREEQEAKRRAEAEAAAAGGAASSESKAPESTAMSVESTPQTTVPVTEAPAPTTTTAEQPAPPAPAQAEAEAMDEDEEIARAIAMSLEEEARRQEKGQ